MDSLKVTGQKCLMVRRLIIRNQLKPAHLVNNQSKDKKKAQNLNVSQEEEEEEHDGFDGDGEKSDMAGRRALGSLKDRNEMLGNAGTAVSSDVTQPEKMSGLDAQLVGLKLLQL